MNKRSRVPLSEIYFEFTRSRGPGGQHVNKTESAAILRWWPAYSEAFSPLEKDRLLLNLKNKLTKEGELLIRSDEFRDREQNKSRCLDKLDEMLRAALYVPKDRKKTKPTRSSQRKRVQSKILRGDIKSSRKKVDWD